MIVGWRLCRAPFAALDGEGARRFGGRWNSPSRPVVYLADHPALAALELLVHLDLLPEDLPDDYVLLQATLPEQAERGVAASSADVRQTGDEWLASRRAPALRVASVLVPHAENLLLNPLHEDAISARVKDSTSLVSIRRC